MCDILTQLLGVCCQEKHH